jgi:tRNA-modifying protein YgfZ
MTDRTILALTGADRESFLQGLISNDVTRAKDSIIYAALLTPQGKYIADFFVIGQPDTLLIDVASPLAAQLTQRLTMYKLRAQVQIAASDLQVSRGVGPAPVGALADPRHPALGWRHYGDGTLSDATDWDAIRVAHCIPESGIELTQDSYILESGFERLHGVDFKKGCYVGQEVTARMKHKTELKKGLTTVAVDGPAAQGTEITADGKPAGTLLTRSGNHAIAYLRFDRTDNLQAGTATVTLT